MPRTPTAIDTTPRQLAALIHHHCRMADLAATEGRRPLALMIWGDGGLGKSRITEQVAHATGRRYLDFRAMIKDLPDLQGYPILSGMEQNRPAPMTAPADLPPSDSLEPWIVVLEELPGAPRMMQAALYGLVLEGRLNSYHLPRNTLIVATGNLATSGGVVNAMPFPLRSRFRNTELILAPDEMLDHAMQTGWHPLVTAYHTMTRGADWLAFDAKRSEAHV